jgi:hypothetical protein
MTIRRSTKRDEVLVNHTEINTLLQLKGRTYYDTTTLAIRLERVRMKQRMLAAGSLMLSS